jgi:hypothetical protein
VGPVGTDEKFPRVGQCRHRWNQDEGERQRLAFYELSKAQRADPDTYGREDGDRIGQDNTDRMAR